MKGNQNGCYPLQDVLNFMSINVGRGVTTHDIALARASELKTDFLLVQEPWWYNTTKSHPYFDLYLPFGGENIRPRAATHVRKDPTRINSSQKHPLTPTGDYCWVEVNGIMFHNVYKAPHDPSAVNLFLTGYLHLKQWRLGILTRYTRPGNLVPVVITGKAKK